MFSPIAPARFARLAELADVRPVRVAETVRNEPVEPIAERNAACAAEHGFRGTVEQHDALLAVDGDDRVHRRVDDRGDQLRSVGAGTRSAGAVGVAHVSGSDRHRFDTGQGRVQAGWHSGHVAYPASELVIDPVLIRKYDVAGPRYTSYPTADRLSKVSEKPSTGTGSPSATSAASSAAFSLYVHLPFCDSICYYCACNKVVTRDHGRSAKYIKYLAQELAATAGLLGGRRRVSQLHFGGGTPTFLSPGEMRALATRSGRSSTSNRMPSARSRSIRASSSPAAWGRSAALGFNRISIGVQDFDPAVQQAVHRVQSEEETRRALDEARALGFRSANLDLIYGLPKQSLDSFNATLGSRARARSRPHRALQLCASAFAVQAAARIREAICRHRRRSCRS
jgi:hypothetical protein